MLSESEAPWTPVSKDALSTSTESELKQQLLDERKAHAVTRNELEVERAAHDETAENMVELQHKLEVTLQELANLEKFVKRQQKVDVEPRTPMQVQRLHKEETYLRSRLVYVQQELLEVKGQERSDDAVADAGASKLRRRSGAPAASEPAGATDKAPLVAQRLTTAEEGGGNLAAQNAEERAFESLLSI